MPQHVEATAPSVIERAATALRAAAETRVPCAPVREILQTDSDLQVAYAVQRANVEIAIQAGRRLAGRKVGLTSEVVQHQLGVDQPDFGTLFADMCVADGVNVPSASLIQPRAEVELALVLNRDLKLGQHTITDVIDATRYVLPAIEIVDSRIAGWDISVVDTVADNASCGFYVLGSRPIALRDVDVRRVRVVLEQNGELVSEGEGSACLGNPLYAVAWLADAMCSRGTPLRAGECIMTGALGPMVDIGPGDSLYGDFGEFGSVTTSLSETG